MCDRTVLLRTPHVFTQPLQAMQCCIDNLSLGKGKQEKLTPSGDHDGSKEAARGHRQTSDMLVQSSRYKLTSADTQASNRVHESSRYTHTDTTLFARYVA